MCKVRDIDTCEKKIYIHMLNGEVISSEWFYDDQRRGNSRGTEMEEKVFNALVNDNHINLQKVKDWDVTRNRDEEDCIYISNHAFKRMRERNGWNRKTALRMVQKIYDNGLEPEDVPSEYRGWTMHEKMVHPEKLFKFYGEMLYVFADSVLLTVLHGKPTRCWKNEKIEFC